MRLVTWNINSIRLRLDNVRRLIAEWAPEILCLQETKTQDGLFPREAFEAIGYRYMLVHGMKGYNGVAILSRIPFKSPQIRAWCARTDCRHATVELPGAVELHNIYVPAGGDLNIAPLETDVWSHKQLLSVVSHTPVEVERLRLLQQAGGFVDAVRHFVPPPERLYTWWSYRARDWSASNRGRRLDHVWVTPSLVGALDETRVYRDSRSWNKASDHVPVMVAIGC